MKTVIIGSGNLATHLSLALKASGMPIAQVYSRTAEHAGELAAKLGCPFTAQVDDVLTDAELYIISVNDDAISGVAVRLCKARPQGVFLHTAGSVPMSVFRPYGVRHGVLYPMQTFSKNRAVDFRTIPCFIEASDEPTLALVRRIASSISDHVVIADSEKRRKLHLAAVLACNLANHCYRLAERVLEQEHIDFSLYLPLIQETARKVTEMSPREAQTGPMVRYDLGVMAAQVSLLPDERTRQIYRLMAESIHEDSLLCVK